MKLSKLLLFCLVLSGCVTQQKCAERFPSVQHDSIVRTEKLIHDTLYKDFDEEEVNFDEGWMEMDTAINYHHEEKKGSKTAILNIRKGKIKVTCKEEAYRDTIAFLRKQITTSEKKTIIPQAVVKYVEPWAYKPLLCYFGITSLLAIGFAAGKWFKVF